MLLVKVFEIKYGIGWILDNYDFRVNSYCFGQLVIGLDKKLLQLGYDYGGMVDVMVYWLIVM